MPIGEDKFIIPTLSTLQPIEELQGRGFPTFIDSDYVSDWGHMQHIEPVLSCGEAAEFHGECIFNPNAMRKLLGVDLGIGAWTGKTTLSFTCASPVKVPVRKHRKKRIAKKWAKRYGYRYEFREIRLRDVSIIPDYDDICVTGKVERRIVR